MKKWLALVLTVLLGVTLFGVFAYAAEPAEVASYDEMVTLIRDGLLAREDTIRFRYTGNDYRAPSANDLFAYGDNGAAGDYLRMSMSGAFPAVTLGDDGIYTVTASYFTTAQQEAEVAAYVDGVLAGCEETQPEAVARYIYEYLCGSVLFDLENLYNEEDQLKYTAYGAVSQGKAVCQGFAQLYYRLAKAAGLDCRIVTGIRAGENHAWNIVKAGEKWYHVDAACGSQLLDNSGYFLKPLFNRYAIVYGDYTAAEIRNYPFATASGGDELVTDAINYQISYTLNKTTGELIISGSGDLPYYSYQAESPFNSNQYIRSVVISEGITGLERYLFPNCRNLKEVHLPSSVRAIASRVFYGCANLDTFYVDSDNEIFFSTGSCIVRKADGTLAVGVGKSVIPNDGSVTAIGTAAFAECAHLTELTIPESVTEIKDRAFNGCTGLARIDIPNGVTSIGVSAFYGCTALTEIQIPGSVTAIGNQAFENCTALSNVTLSNGIETIGADAFSTCQSLTRIYIPDSVISLGNEKPFNNCPALDVIEVGENNTVYSASGNCLIDTAKKTLIKGTALSVIPSDGSVTKIGWMAFAYCRRLAELEIPDCVTYIGQAAFNDCTGLTRIKLPSNLYYIGLGAFMSCTGLTEITLPASVREIDWYPFYNCTGIERFSVEEGNPRFSGSGNCLVNMNTKTLIQGFNNSVIPNDGSVTKIDNHAFNHMKGLRTVQIPSSVQSIEASAFESCTGLSEIVLPDSVTSLGNSVFSGCPDLKIVIPASVTNIGNYAFSSSAVIYGSEGTYAQTYANANRLRFVPVCTATKAFHSTVYFDETQATCTEGGYTAGEQCAECGEWLSGHELTQAPLGHDPAEAVRENVVEPTCTKEGSYDNVVRCKRCGEVLSAAAETIAMTAHKDVLRDGYCDDCGAYICAHGETDFINEKAATCTENGYTGDTVCLICGRTLTYGETVFSEGHKPCISLAVVPSTCLKTGFTARYSCAVCNETLTEREITPVSGHTDKNGDGMCDVCRAPLGCKRYGECGENCFWYVENGTLVISGSGATYTYTAPAAWAEDEFDYVYIKEGVTAVDGAAFNECEGVAKVFAPAGTVVSGCGRQVLTYTFTDGAANISGAVGGGAFNAYDLLNAAYVLCLDHEVTGLRFDRLQLSAADGAEYTEYDILRSGKIVDENHFRLASGAVVNDFFVKPAAYASFNRVQATFGAEPDRNLILRVECADLLPAELRAESSAYTEQLVLRFVDEPAPAEDDAPHGGMWDTIVARFRATLAAILALFKKIIKLFKRG